MTPRLRALLVATGVLIVGGTAYITARPGPGVTRADLLDAGIAEDCDKVLIACQVRNHCRHLPDGGTARRYGTVRGAGYLCQRAGADVLISRWPKGDAGEDCYEMAGDSACRILQAPGTCDDAEVCADTGEAQTPVAVALDQCFCRNADAGACRRVLPDGGLGANLPRNVTYAGDVAGAGCVRKVCSEAAGEWGESMPTVCM
jgi:hypothetical protein